MSIRGHQSLLLVQLFDTACVLGGLGTHVVPVRQIAIFEEDSVVGVDTEGLGEDSGPINRSSHLCELVPFESLRLSDDQCIGGEAEGLSNHFFKLLLIFR